MLVWIPPLPPPLEIPVKHHSFLRPLSLLKFQMTFLGVGKDNCFSENNTIIIKYQIYVI